MVRSSQKFHGKYRFKNVVRKQVEHDGGGILDDIRKIPTESDRRLSSQESKTTRHRFQGEGIARKRINEPMFKGRPPASRPEVFNTDEVSRQVPRVETDPLKNDFLPGDQLKMKLIRKMIKKKPKKQVGGGKNFHVNIAHVLFPKLVKMLDPNAQLPKQGLNGLERIIKSNPKNAHGIIADVLTKMGFTVPPKGKQLIKIAVDKGYNRNLTSSSDRRSTVGDGFQGTGLKKLLKDKAFWKDFSKGFKSAMKVGLPIAAIIAPELAPLALAADLLS